MAFLVYNKETTYLANVGKKDHFKSRAAANAAMTRALRNGWIHDADDYAIAECQDFYKNIEKTKVVKNMMSGEDVTIPVNTPSCIDPSSERYWSM